MDFIQYDQIRMLTEKKKGVSRELKKLTTEQFNNALKFEESVYKSLKDGHSRKHVESFSIMLSGCHNRRITGFEEMKIDRKSTRLNSSHLRASRMPSSA